MPTSPAPGGPSGGFLRGAPTRWLPEAPTQDALLARYGEVYNWIALAVVGSGIIAAVLAMTSFNVAVPALGAHFGIGQHQVQCAISGFLAALTLVAAVRMKPGR